MYCIPTQFLSRLARKESNVPKLSSYCVIQILCPRVFFCRPMYHKKTIYTNCIWFKVHLCKKATKLDSKRLFPSITVKKRPLQRCRQLLGKGPRTARGRICASATMPTLGFWTAMGSRSKKVGAVSSFWAKAPGRRKCLRQDFGLGGACSQKARALLLVAGQRPPDHV